MERYTRTVDGKVTVAPEEMAAALERLSAFEDMACGVEREREREEISARLEELRNRGREKTVQFRELLAQKLVNNNMKLLLERYRIH